MPDSMSEEQRDQIFDDYIKSELDDINDREAEDIYEGKENLKQIIRQKLIKDITTGRYKWSGDVDNHTFVKYYRTLFQDRAVDYIEPRTIGAVIERTRERGVAIEPDEEREIKEKARIDFQRTRDGLRIMMSAGKGLTERSKESIREHISAYNIDDISYHGFVYKGVFKMGVFSKIRRGFVTTWTIKEG